MNIYWISGLTMYDICLNFQISFSSQIHTIWMIMRRQAVRILSCTWGSRKKIQKFAVHFLQSINIKSLVFSDISWTCLRWRSMSRSHLQAFHVLSYDHPILGQWISCPNVLMYANITQWTPIYSQVNFYYSVNFKEKFTDLTLSSSQKCC